MDLYSYANGDPINFIDPTGRGAEGGQAGPNSVSPVSKPAPVTLEMLTAHRDELVAHYERYSNSVGFWGRMLDSLLNKNPRKSLTAQINSINDSIDFVRTGISIFNTVNGNSELDLDVNTWDFSDPATSDLMTLGNSYVGLGEIAFFGSIAVSLKAAKTLTATKSSTSLWVDGFPGIQTRRFGDVWVKRVNPNANRFSKWWGKETIDAQFKGLQKLGDMATPSAMRNGMLFTQDVGATFSGGYFSLLTNSTAMRNYVRGSIRMRNPINDIVPRNMGTNGVIFDPAIDRFTQSIGVAFGVGVAYGTYEAITP